MSEQIAMLISQLGFLPALFLLVFLFVAFLFLVPLVCRFLFDIGCILWEAARMRAKR